MSRIKYREAIGQEVKRGRPRIGPTPSKADLVRLYIREGRSVREVARILGVTKDAIHRALKANEMPSRTPAKRSRLRDLDQTALFSDIVLFGVNKTAERRNIPLRTLKDYLAALRRANGNK